MPLGAPLTLAPTSWQSGLVILALWSPSLVPSGPFVSSSCL